MSKPLNISIIDFFESDAILGITTLSPAQKVILKAIVGEVLDDSAPILRYHEFIDRDFDSEVDLFLFLTGKDEYIPGKQYQDVSLDAGRRGGKTLRKGTEVLTPYGPKAIETLEVGDTIYGYNRDGSISEAKVKDTIYNGVKTLYPLISSNKALVYASEDHRFMTRTYRTKNKPPIERALKNFAKKDQYIERRFVQIPCGEVYEPHAYAIGALLGDGCARQNTCGGKKIWISNPEEVLVAKVAQILGVDAIRKNHPTNYSWEIIKDDIHCNYYNEWMKARYAHEKTVDLEVIKTWNRRSVLSYMAGLLDTDGSVSVTQDGRLEISLGMQAKPVVESFQYLFYKLYGRKVPLREEDKRGKYKNGNIWIFKLANNQYTKRFLHEVNPYLTSVARKWKPEYADLVERNYKEDRIGVKVDWEASVQDHSYDIEVDNDTNLYVLANEGLITHNSNVIGAGLCCYWATQKDFSPYLGTSPFATMPIISPTKEQAGEVYAATKNFFLRSPYLFQEFLNGDVDRLEPEYDEESTDKRRFVGGQIKLNNKVVIKTLTADISRIRGFAVPFYILDECCWFGTEGSDTKNTDVGINEAIQPATAQFGDLAFGLKISSPNGETGLMYSDYQCRKDEDVLHLQVPTWYMNQNITAAYLEKQKKKGLHYYNREYGAQYVASENSYLDPKLLEKCMIPIELIPHQAEFRYVAAMDYATKDDYWTFAIGHKEYHTYDIIDKDGTAIKEKQGIVFCDLLMHWRGIQGNELDPSLVVIEIAQKMREYKVAFSLADQYAFAALKTLIMQHGQNIKEFAASAQSKKKYMYSLQVGVNSGTLKFVSNQLALKHLKDLREKRTSSGTIKIEHAQGCKDDYADVIALIAYQFDKSSPVYIGHTKDDEFELGPETKDRLGKFISTPTAMDLAEHVGITGFHDSSFEYKGKEKIEEEEEEDDSAFWFIM